MKSSEIVSEVIPGGVRSPCAVALSAEKEYLNRIPHNTIFSSKLIMKSAEGIRPDNTIFSSKSIMENFGRIRLAMDNIIINATGCSEKG